MPNSAQNNAYNASLTTGVGLIQDAYGNNAVVGAKMAAGAGAGNVLQSDGSGNLTLGAGLTLLATTGASGFALQNGTPTILTWTAPNDGGMHRVLVESLLLVTSGETGGAVNLSATDPAGNSHSYTLLSSNQSTGGVRGTVTFIAVQAGTAVTVVQTALSGGAATLWAELWGS